MSATATVSDRLRALDAAWFTRVLREGGHAQATVREAVVEPVAFTGATTDLARARLAYGDDGPPGPASVVLKIRGTSDVQRGMDAAMGLFAREARFYAELAGEVPVGTPRCLHAGDGDATPLVLEDLGVLRMGDQVAGLAMADAEPLMDALAALHAAFWASPRLDALDWLVAPAEGPFAQMVVQLVASGGPAVAEGFRGRAPEATLGAVCERAPRWDEVLRRCAEGPPTLVHNDCRLDNVFFAPDGSPTLVDWQIPARTRGTADVGNLLAGSMDPELLAESWEALLRRYHDGLRDRGVRGYGWEECVTHYRQSVLYPLGAGLALLGAMPIDDDRGLGEAIVLRALHHAADLDAFASL